MASSAISLLAYRAFAPKELSKKQNTVLAFLLKYGSMSNKELAAKIGWPINTITRGSRNSGTSACWSWTASSGTIRPTAPRASGAFAPLDWGVTESV